MIVVVFVLVLQCHFWLPLITAWWSSKAHGGHVTFRGVLTKIDAQGLHADGLCQASQVSPKEEDLCLNIILGVAEAPDSLSVAWG